MDQDQNMERMERVRKKIIARVWEEEGFLDYFKTHANEVFKEEFKKEFNQELIIPHDFKIEILEEQENHSYFIIPAYNGQLKNGKSTHWGGY